MAPTESQWLLRIYLGESDRVGGAPAYEWLVREAKKAKLAGATALRGIMGFGAKSHLHTFKIERLSLDLPVVVEIVDERERLDRYLDAVTPMLTEGVLTLERVEIRAIGPRLERDSS